MKILGIDTTKKRAKIFVIDSKNQEKNYFVDINEEIKHSEGLFLYLEKALLENRMEISDFDGFACVVGPGSFTGIRVGMATIKGFNKVNKKSVIAINAFEVMSVGIKHGLLLLNSTSTSCYYAKVQKGQIIETGVVDKSKIGEISYTGEVVVLKEEQSEIGIEYNNCRVINDLSEQYSACIIEKLDKGDYGEFLPYYLQLSQAERNLQ